MKTFPKVLIGTPIEVSCNILKSCAKVLRIDRHFNKSANMAEPKYNSEQIGFNWKKCKANGVTGLCHIFSNSNNCNCFKDFDELIYDCNIPKSEYLKYNTLRHCIENCVPIEKLRICVHTFKNVLYSPNLQNKNAVKLSYSTLNDGIDDQFDVCAKKWARDLHKQEEELSWNGIWKNARQPFQCIKNKLRQFKIVNRLYYTLSKLFTMGLQEDSKCPKCGNTDGTLFDLLWDCNKIK